MADIFAIANQLRTKLTSGDPITDEDLERGRELARMSGRIDDFVLYANLKRAHESGGTDKE